MNPIKRLVISPLSGLFNLPDYYNPTLTDKDRELISLKFMLYYNSTNFNDNGVPTLAALLSLGHLKLIVIDGYTEPVWFRARTVMAGLIRSILPEKVTLNLLETNVKYVRATSDIDMHDHLLSIQEKYKEEGFTIINLFETDWSNYIRAEFPELFPTQTEDDSGTH